MKRITDFDKEESLTHFETTVKEAKIKMVLSNNREFVEILINGNPDKPYYEIHYIENGEHHIGYSSYNIKIISEYIRDFFIGKRNVLELPDEKHTNFAEVVKHNHIDVVGEYRVDVRNIRKECSEAMINLDEIGENNK